MDVWTNTVDGTYKVSVEQKPGDGYSGTLIVADGDGVILHQEDVAISYGARFGPDTGDVAEWSERCIDVIDYPEHRKPPEVASE